MPQSKWKVRDFASAAQLGPDPQEDDTTPDSHGGMTKNCWPRLA